MQIAPLALVTGWNISQELLFRITLLMANSRNIITVEDAGFRKLCPKEFPKASNLKHTLELGGYEVLQGDEFLFCKPLSTKTTLVRVEATISRSNFRDWDQILASLDFLYKAEIPSDVTPVTISDADADKLLERFLERPMPQSLHALTSLLFWPMPERLQTLLEKVVPKFLDKYPAGRLHFVRVSQDLARMQAASRVLTAIDGFGFEVFEDPKIRDQRGSELLSRIHPRTLEPVIESTIKTLLSCFFRYVFGACVSRIGGIIFVQIDPPCEFELPYIRDRWDFNRLGGLFETNANLDLGEYLQNKPLTPEQARRAYKRFVFQGPWTAQEFENLLKWTVGRLNNFLLFTVDLCNYSNDGRYIDFIRQRKINLTLERIIAEINYIITEVDPFIRKTLYFNLHDKLATLPNPTDLSKRKRIFNRLFRLSHYRYVLRLRLSSLPAPFNNIITSLGDTLFEDVINGCINSVWAQYRVSKKGIRTRQINSTVNGYITQKMKDKSDLYVSEDYAVNFLHEMRNSLHGYQLQGSGFEEFLLMHYGDLPDSLPDLSLIWYFLLLADTQGLISGEWTKGVSPREARKQ